MVRYDKQADACVLELFWLMSFVLFYVAFVLLPSSVNHISHAYFHASTHHM